MYRKKYKARLMWRLRIRLRLRAYEVPFRGFRGLRLTVLG